MSMIHRGLLGLVYLLALASIACSALAHAPGAPWAALAHASFRHQSEAAMGVGTALAQDRTGFVWLGTATGLVRWDGLSLRRYVARPGQADALPDNFVLSLLVDRAGRLWVGTDAGGLARYDATTDRFVAVRTGAGGLRHPRIASIADDGRGGVWVGTGAGLERVAADGRVDRSAPATLVALGGVDTVLRDRSGGLWIGTRRALLYRSDAGGARDAPWRTMALPGRSGQPAGVSSLYQDGAGRIWIGTRGNGAFVLDGPNQLPRPVVDSAMGTGVSENTRPAPDHAPVLAIVEKNPGVMWIGTEGDGIVEVDAASGNTRRIRHVADVRDSLRDDDVRALLRERNGTMFVATVDALSQHDPLPQGVVTVRTTGGSTLSLPSVLAHPGGRIWQAVAGGAVEMLDPASGAVQRIPGDGLPGNLPKGRVLAMANGPDGSVFLGSQQGLYRVDGNGRALRRMAVPGRSASAPVWALAWRDGVLWLGGLDGVWAIAPTAAPALLRHEDASLGDSRVTALLPLANGDVWVGTRAGAARLAAGSSEVELLPTDAADPTRLAPGYISSIIQDGRGRLWFANYNGGVAVIERSDAAGRHWFRRIHAGHGLPDNSVNALVADLKGQIWLSTDQGVASVDPISYGVRRLNSADGVQILAYWTGAAARSTAGDIVFGGLSGLTVVRPDRLQRRGGSAPLAITKVMLGGRELPFAAFDAATAEPARLTVAPGSGARGFAIEFALLDFGAPQLHRYAYRLQGFDRDWIETDSQNRRISYTSVPPGDYTLELRASTSAGGPTVTRQLAVRALPAWHQQIWLQAALGIGASALVLGMLHARTSLLRRRQRELESMVEARTAQLQATQAQLEKIAYDDPLTGLPNRRRFTEESSRMAALGADGADAFVLVLIDLDHFKTINDTLGHDAGDALLVVAAARLRHAVRDGDLVARLGGDEFAVLLTPTAQVDPIEQVEQICARIVSVMTEPVPFGEHLMRVSASVGAACLLSGPDALTRTYKMADQALYAAKNAGRNGWRLATPVAERPLASIPDG